MFFATKNIIIAFLFSYFSATQVGTSKIIINDYYKWWQNEVDFSLVMTSNEVITRKQG